MKRWFWAVLWIWNGVLWSGQNSFGPILGGGGSGLQGANVGIHAGGVPAYSGGLAFQRDLNGFLAFRAELALLEVGNGANVAGSQVNQAVDLAGAPLLVRLRWKGAEGSLAYVEAGIAPSFAVLGRTTVRTGSNVLTSTGTQGLTPFLLPSILGLGTELELGKRPVDIGLRWYYDQLNVFEGAGSSLASPDGRFSTVLLILGWRYKL